MRRTALLLFLFGLGASGPACDDGAQTTGGGGNGGDGGDGGGGAPVCLGGTPRWAPGTKAFEEATSDWALDTIGVQGVRINAVDFDGDGWADLVVRRGGPLSDDFAPGGTRQTWLLRNNREGQFEDVTEASGIRQSRLGGDPNIGRPGEVFAFADVDNDGDLDVFTGLTEGPNAPLDETSELLLNSGDGTFVLGPENNAFRLLPPQFDAVAGASFTDVDRDGLIDLWVGENSVDSEPQQDRLYNGDGTGLFSDGTAAFGLTTQPWSSISTLNQAKSHTNAWSSLACDLNNDGNPELLAASYGRAPNHLWQSSGPGDAFEYSNRSIDSGYAFDHRTDWSDNESARCWCTLHPTDEDCAGVPPPMFIACTSDDDAFRWNHLYDREPFRLGGNGGTTLCADIDNDGDMDLMTHEIVHWDVGSSSDPSELLLNSGATEVLFERPGSEVTGLTREHQGVDWNDGDITGSLFDFDNDGWTDVYIGATDYPGNHGLLFHQDSPAHFVSVPIGDGVDHHRSHGSAVADFDRDGDLDLVVGHSRSRCDPDAPDDCYATTQVRFFRNVMGGHHLQLHLVGGADTNRAAIGARVTVKAGEVTQTKEVGGGHGHYGMQDDLVVHFGLGEACTAEVTVRWPDAALTTETFTLDGDQRFRIEQGQAPTVAP